MNFELYDVLPDSVESRYVIIYIYTFKIHFLPVSSRKYCRLENENKRRLDSFPLLPGCVVNVASFLINGYRTKSSLLSGPTLSVYMSENSKIFARTLLTVYFYNINCYHYNMSIKQIDNISIKNIVIKTKNIHNFTQYSHRRTYTVYTHMARFYCL